MSCILLATRSNSIQYFKSVVFSDSTLLALLLRDKSEAFDTKFPDHQDGNCAEDRMDNSSCRTKQHKQYS